MNGRTPASRASIRKVDVLLARYASRPSLLDAINAMCVLDSAGPAAPTLTSLALTALRAERGRARPMPPLTVAELFERRAAACSPEQVRTVRSVRAVGRFLAKRLGPGTPVASLSCRRVEEALSVARNPWTYNWHFAYFRAAVNWAVKAKLLDSSPICEMVPKRIEWTEPGFLSPEHVERIFRIAEEHPGAVESGVGTFLALGFFAGVRSAEIFRAEWEDIDIEGTTLRIPRPKGWTSGLRPRIVELEPNAVAWLRLWRDWTRENGRKTEGRIVRNPHDISAWKAKRLRPVGLSWDNTTAHNAPRHTYATMHVGAFRDAAATALNLGHLRGTDMLERHYRGLVPMSVAALYWQIVPSRHPAPPEPLPGRGYRSDILGDSKSGNEQ